MERRLTTIVAADLVGYSRLVAADEEAVIERFRDLRLAVVAPNISKAKGRIVKTMGDGLLIEFPSPEAALRAAQSVQTEMAAREASHAPDLRLTFRIGINWGEVIVDGDDVLGDVVNIAARLESLAPPGGICLSQAARGRIRDDFPAEFSPLGLQYVKNMPTPVDVWNVKVDGVTAAPNTPVPRNLRPSVAVLAFDNLSGESEDGYLADGLVEDVLTQLSRFRSLFVIARNSSFSYKGTHKDVRQIAHELGVRYVVEGSVRRSGHRIRVSVSLVDADRGTQLWSGRWDRDLSDLFELQDELTRAIVIEIAPQLGANERALARTRPTESLTA